MKFTFAQRLKLLFGWELTPRLRDDGGIDWFILPIRRLIFGYVLLALTIICCGAFLLQDAGVMWNAFHAR